MTGPPPQRPAVDPTELTPEQWQEYLASARAALKADPQDREALQAIRDANFALNAYDEAAAASPGERIATGVSEGAKGLGQAALDIPRGILSAIFHPVQTVKNLPKVPGALAEGLSSDDPAQVARTVGNIGGILLPFAKTSGAPGAGTVGAAATRALRPSNIARGVRAVTPPIVQSVAKKVTPPIVTRALERLTTPAPPPPVAQPLPGLLSVGDDIGAPPIQAPVRSVTNTPPVMGRRPLLPTGEPMDAPTFLRRAQDLVPDLSGTTIAGLRRLLANPRTSAELRAAIETELARRLQGAR